jgi:hypothetical protein
MSRLIAIAPVLLFLWAAVASPQEPVTPPAAQLGVQFPSIARLRYYTHSAIVDIRDNLHASYVRTGWIPDWFKYEKVRWTREDEAMHRLCSAGLKVMIITPSPNDDDKGERDLIDDIGEFFSRYDRLDPHCVQYAELANEADLPRNGFKDVKAYARYYEMVAPLAAEHGAKVITSGTSGKDLPWIYALGSILRNATPEPPIDGIGFHPYGIAPRDVAAATLEMRRAAGPLGNKALPDAYITELGRKNAEDLYASLVALAQAAPAVNIFEYETQPDDEIGFGLKNNPALYDAVKRAWGRGDALTGAPGGR